MSTWIKRQCAAIEKGQKMIKLEFTLYIYEHFYSLCHTFKALSHLFTESIYINILLDSCLTCETSNV